MSRNIAAIVGGGVIGGGWAARFLLNGWDVRVFDPDPQAERKIGEVLANARRSLPGLYDVALPPEGELRFCATIAETVTGADWIQESVPERLDIKHRVIREIQAAARTDAVLGSSTSGYKPSELAEGATNPAQIMVAHPFNPVYLLPVIELVPQPGTDPVLVERAQELLRGVGLKPLRVRKEIDAHIADRFLEAVWREALWLVKDDIATTEEIDDAIRFGFGIRWAQMGLFETYRVAGGEAGMAHFIAQFGPCLKWPWTKLMDVPELTDDLVHKISSQSDAQSGMHTIRELERIRDDNLVAIMRALKGRDWGAGAALLEHDRRLTASRPDADWRAPVPTLARAIPQNWTDYNGHMNEAHYLELFSKATDRTMELLGCDADYIASGGSYFTVETHIRHLDEALAGDRVQVSTQLLEGEGKRLHLYSTLRHEDGRVLATAEQLLLHVSLQTRRTAPPGGRLAEGLARAMAAQSLLPRPDGLCLSRS
ncbi:MAG: carnitine 3-dehydrogenase [Gammaproteobacteria bacterium]